MKVVIDTNVLVAGLLSPFGPCGEIARMVAGQALVLLLDSRLFAEYQDVLHRPRFRFDARRVEAFLDQVLRAGEQVSSLPLSRNSVQDPDDLPFLEVAVAGGATALVTGNLAHFLKGAYRGVPIMSPAAFLVYYRKNKGIPE